MTDAVETPEDYGNDNDGMAKRWLAAIRLAGKNQHEWEERGKKIVKRYRDERESSYDGAKRFNILWSNVETLKPAVYAKTPKPQVSRRYKDDDPLGRHAAMVLERALEYSVDAYDFDDVVRSNVEDMLLPGRGVSRVVYTPTMGTAVDEGGQEYEEVVYEEAGCEYVFWRDFRHGAARKWSQVPWVAFRAYMTRDELVARFGDEMGRQIPLNYKPGNADDEESEEQFKKGMVWEIWNKADRSVYWVAEGFESKLLDKMPAPMSLHGFFPCPKPLLAVTTNDSLIPVPEFVEYQDQADELDQLTARIAALVKALKVAGIYAADAPAFQRLLDESCENVLVPVDDWAMFAQRGGLEGIISWLPMDQIIQTVLGLYDAREKTKQELYEITGLSDIIRGASMASETATAQRIKGQFATLRLSDRQEQVSKFARDLIRLKAEVISEHFSAETLQLMTGLEVNEQVMELLRNDPARSFRIDIETDSTLQVDEQADKESRVEFMQAAGGFLSQAIEAYGAMPQLGPLLGQMMMFGIRGFRAGRELEESFEEAMQALGQQQEQQGQEGGDPEAEAKAAKIQQDMQMEQAKMQMNMQEVQTKMQADQAKLQMEMQMMQEKFSAESARSAQEHEIKMQEGQQDLQKGELDIAKKKQALRESD